MLLLFFVKQRLNRFSRAMGRMQKISIVALIITGLLGLFRGYRLIQSPTTKSLLFPYPEDMMSASVFSNYSILGLVIFFFIGIFSIVAVLCTVYRIRNYAYFILVEGIFLSFLTLIHIVVSGFFLIHVFVLALCILIIVLGIRQTPREF
jgi:hypothetical protein